MQIESFVSKPGDIGQQILHSLLMHCRDADQSGRNCQLVYTTVQVHKYDVVEQWQQSSGKRVGCRWYTSSMCSWVGDRRRDRDTIRKLNTSKHSHSQLRRGPFRWRRLCCTSHQQTNEWNTLVCQRQTNGVGNTGHQTSHDQFHCAKILWSLTNFICVWSKQKEKDEHCR